MAIPKEEPQDVILPPPSTKTTATKKPDEKGRKDALKAITAHRRVSAWQIHRWPLEKRILSERVRVHLPRTYLAQEGEDVRVLRAGQDLNQFVFRHYSEEVTEEQKKERTNFVTPDGIVARRHEYLGPDPRVAGYRVDNDGDIYIKWWDGFLQDQWIGKQKWKFGVKLNVDGKWIEMDD
ncbi:uncharacterized protein FIBRA_09107 [Fibroporia radiculosa]|uniref:Uncharacterized protein n=1 Tax=Fibroporia radiculosa TaxID=599839 RepID=J4ICQ2_9APHY|nr:uncharacterized protein FIBRA_09107 [Fibroporia radiculosa]CCM06806.1 predicted protein [Fibroporia radiculosa]